MSFLSKLFGGKPKADFILHHIDFEVPPNKTLKDGEYLWATIEFESKYPCQLWLHLNSDQVFVGETTGGYHPSDVYPAGRHKVKRYFYINNINVENYPNGFVVNGGRIIAQDENGYTLYSEMHPTDCTFVSLTADELEIRKNIDKEGLRIEFAKAFVSDELQLKQLSPNDHITIDREIGIELHIQSNPEVYFSCMLMTDEDISYNHDPMHRPLNGLLHLHCTVREVGKINGFVITAYNRYYMAIEQLTVEFPLIVENWYGDGVNGQNALSVKGIIECNEGESNQVRFLAKNARLSANAFYCLYLSVQSQATHGVIIDVYDVVGGKVCDRVGQWYCGQEQLNEFQGEMSFVIDWVDREFVNGKPRQVSGFVIVMSNMVGEVLAEQAIDYPLTVIA